jgi:hypothetical protein
VTLATQVDVPKVTLEEHHAGQVQKE